LQGGATSDNYQGAANQSGAAHSTTASSAGPNPQYEGSIEINGDPNLILFVTAHPGWLPGQVLKGRPVVNQAMGNGQPAYSTFFDWAEATIIEERDTTGKQVVTARVSRVRLAGTGPGTASNTSSDLPLRGPGGVTLPFVTVKLVEPSSSGF
jgi:hypothetical protein